jgi:hypothetical protein
MVSPGQALAARVLAVAGGQVELALAGRRVSAQTDLVLTPGQTVQLVVGDAEAERVTLRIAGQGTTGSAPAAPSPSAILEEAGLPPNTARAILAAVSQTGTTPTAAADLTRLAVRAQESGVRSPAEATAFARLEAAALPTTPAAVRGLAALLEGSPIGRALATLLGEANAAARTPGTDGSPASPTPPVTLRAPGAAAQAPGSPVANWPSGPLPSGQPGITGSIPAATPGTVPTPAQGTSPGAPSTHEGEPVANWPSTQRPIGQPGARPGEAPPQGRFRTAPGGSLGDLVASLSRLADAVAEGATSGDPVALRNALRELGHGIEAELARGRVPDEETLRTRLHELASRPGTEAVLGRAAERLSDAIAAQTLAGATLPGSDPAIQGTQSQGVYVQVPLPGGQSAEVRVNPDAQGEGPDGEKRARRIAFLLHLSALGPVLIEATHGPTGTEAIVRVTSSLARSYLAERSHELADALGRAADRPNGVRIAVERFSGPPPARLLPPPPATGLDFQA